MTDDEFEKLAKIVSDQPRWTHTPAHKTIGFWVFFVAPILIGVGLLAHGYLG